MIGNKFNLTEEVFYFDASSETVKSSAVEAICHRFGKTSYILEDGAAVAENAAFRSREECVSYYASLFAIL